MQARPHAAVEDENAFVEDFQEIGRHWSVSLPAKVRYPIILEGRSTIAGSDSS